MKWRIFTLSVILGFLFYQCELPEPGSEWSPNYYGPIAKTQINIEDASKLEDIVFEEEVDAQQLDSRFQGEVDSVPARIFPLDKKIGPTTFTVTDIFERIEVETLHFRISFENSYPIDIAAGTVFSFYNEGDSTEDGRIFSHTLQRDVEPGENFVVEREIKNRDIDNDIDFYIESFNSNGSEDPVTFESDLQTTFKFELIFLSIGELEIQTNQEYELDYTTNFNYRESSEAGQTEGNLFVYFENRFPLSFKTQLYLLDGNKNVTDSLFESPVNLKSAPVTESGGDARPTGDVLNIDTVPLVDDNLRNIKQAEHVRGYFEIATVDTASDGSPLSTVVVSMTKESFLDLQISGDVKGTINTD